jgi:hypothetical protein
LLIELLLVKLVYLEDAIHLALSAGSSPDGGPEEKKKSESPVTISGETDNTKSLPGSSLSEELKPKSIASGNAEPIRIAPEAAGIPALSKVEAQNLPTGKSNARPVSLPIGRFSAIPKDLNDLNRTIESEKGEKGPIEEEIIQEFESDSDIFTPAYEALKTYLEENHKMSLATELSHGRWVLEKGCWKQTVSDAAMKMIMEEERMNLLTFMRSKTGYEFLRLEVTIAEAIEEGERPKIPYTAEERLEWLKINYPEMAEFIEENQGTLIYRKDI